MCANAVIDTFITSKGFNFLFNHITVWIAFSIESNNERPLPHAKGWVAATCFYESVSNNFSCLTFVLTKRGLSNRFISNLSGGGHFYFELVCAIIIDAYIDYISLYICIVQSYFLSLRYINSSPKGSIKHCDDNQILLIAAGKLFGNDDTQSKTVIATHRAFRWLEIWPVFK